MKKRAVITGGAGFIGSNLVKMLLEREYEVHAIDNFVGGKKEDRLDSRAQYHELDLRSYDAIAPIIAGATYVFHEAALPRVQYSIEYPIETFEANVMSTANVLKAAKDGGVKRVVYAASSSAYGDQATMPLSEDMLAQVKSPYGLQKYMGELMCKMWYDVYGLPTVSLRYFNVYGPLLDPDGAYALVIGRFLKQRKEGTPLTITGDGTQTRDFTHVRDVARANILAAESKKVGTGEVINVGAGQNASINELTALIGGPVEHVAPRFEPHDTLADNRKAKELLGWEPTVTLEEGITELKQLWGIT